MKAARTRDFSGPFALAMILSASGCVASAPANPNGQVPVRVTNGGQPYQMWDGATARRAADGICGARGVRSSIYDRYDRATGAWVYPEGCA
jgi:hypothetical protein